MSINHKIVYVPIKSINGNSDLRYPIYIPLIVDDAQTVYATGRLSKRDYINNRKMFRMGGFPIAPLLAALSPIVIPAAIKLGKRIFGKKSNGRLYLGKGEEDEEVEEVPLEDVIMDAINNENMSEEESENFALENTEVPNEEVEEVEESPIEDEDEIEEEIKEETSSGYSSRRKKKYNYSGYIPTNPNIRNLKQLQTLWMKNK